MAEALAEQKRKEEEKALDEAWKKQIQLGDSGNQFIQNREERNQKLIEHVKSKKVVNLEKLGAKFGISSKEVTNVLNEA